MDEDDFTALIIASAAGIYDACMLLAPVSDINAVNYLGNSALLYAASKEHEKIVELLVEKGAAVDASNKAGQTALHRAASKGLDGIISVLVKSKGRVNAMDKGKPAF